MSFSKAIESIKNVIKKKQESDKPDEGPFSISFLKELLDTLNK